MALFALAFAAVAFVPLDDRPVTLQLPLMLGRIAGVAVQAPPARLLGGYLEPARSDAIIAWLNQRAAQPQTDAFVISTDMLAYGGLVASRVPGPSFADAYSRLNELRHLRTAHPSAWIGAFGTIMRLAPTGVPAASNYFAAFPTWTYLQQYANLHDPPLPSEAATAERLRAQIGQATLDAYLATRARNLAVNRILLQMARDGIVDRLVLGQDDAGPIGLHVNEVRLLQSELASYASGRASIEPGADELGMALVARVIARRANWTPRVAVRYSTPDGANAQDPIEYAPIETAISGLIDVCGGVRDDLHPDIVLYVRVPNTTPAQDDAFAAAMQGDVAAGRSAGLADLTMLVSPGAQAAFAERILASGLASRLDAYASWNTNANTVGTVLAESIAAGAGRRMGTYDALAHRTFTFLRFVSDYAFDDEVRPDLIATLNARGITDHTLLAPDVAAAIADRNRALLWGYAARILAQLYPSYHVAALSITLPWSRTFETSVDVGIAPNLSASP